MLYKLVKFLRNIGLDTYFMAKKDQNALIEIAKSEERVIITRDTKFFKEKKKEVPCFYLKDNKMDSGKNILLKLV